MNGLGEAQNSLNGLGVDKRRHICAWLEHHHVHDRVEAAQTTL